jgi:hypothetical protein
MYLVLSAKVAACGQLLPIQNLHRTRALSLAAITNRLGLGAGLAGSGYGG